MKNIITKYNAPNEVLFLKSDLGLYRVVVLDVLQIERANDNPTIGLQVSPTR